MSENSKKNKMPIKWQTQITVLKCVFFVQATQINLIKNDIQQRKGPSLFYNYSVFFNCWAFCLYLIIIDRIHRKCRGREKYEVLQRSSARIKAGTLQLRVLTR